MLERRNVMVGGSALDATLKSLQKAPLSFSEPELQGLIATLPPDLGASLKSPVLGSEWRPASYEAVNELVALCAKARGKDPAEFALALGKEAGRHAVNSFLRLFTTLLGPRRIVLVSKELWLKQYRPAGDLRTSDMSETGVTFELHGFPSHSLGCARVTGWFISLAEAAKAKNVVVKHGPCAGKGGGFCRWVFTWERD
jgi:hypothetical protein